MRVAPGMPADQNIVVNLSGRGDKDLHTLQQVAPERFGMARSGEGR